MRLFVCFLNKGNKSQQVIFSERETYISLDAHTQLPLYRLCFGADGGAGGDYGDSLVLVVVLVVWW